ncbi:MULTISPECIES: hypothetical protein [unclassified Methanoregula]|uniref:hypothetical protein n=1 Tax=unclassified Methanoregula TaxID=2649730 RepID=UPI0009CEB1D1|nr:MULTISPECIES: hypothetical protein [unclassified Methanoregula]OPX63003.1 MAG: hypothetical protein A4E33_01934 [Methanoregula sp. PtaB.Bin085]OPY31581.1 MAG: hypothetical protein A4E34_02774 [Methanoregula sp. PtaU1.Bin006]
MNFRVSTILIICIASVLLAGCTTQPAAPYGTVTSPAIPETPAPVSSPVPVPGAECTRAEDCVPAGCCHPTQCIPASQAQVCDMMCTAVCAGPLDCGAGTCGCTDGKCSIIPAGKGVPSPAGGTNITISSSPKRYSPILSSAPGIGLEPVVSGSSRANATFTWSTTYGQFLSWNSPDFTVNELGRTAQNHGEKIYWSFTDPTTSTATPVTITVTATDTASGRALGSATVTLDWESAMWVRVRE